MSCHTYQHYTQTVAQWVLRCVDSWMPCHTYQHYTKTIALWVLRCVDSWMPCHTYKHYTKTIALWVLRCVDFLNALSHISTLHSNSSTVSSQMCGLPECLVTYINIILKQLHCEFSDVWTSWMPCHTYQHYTQTIALWVLRCVDFLNALSHISTLHSNSFFSKWFRAYATWS